MSKRFAAVPILAASLWLASAAMAAQSRGPSAPHNSAPHTAAPHAAAAKPIGPMSPASLLEQNPKLAAKLAGFFPAGADLTAQAAGFKNLGQFVSTVHVSHNLGIPFDNLKCAELGTTRASALGVSCPTTVTNQDPEILGKAIQMLKPGTNPERAIQEADRQGEQDFQDGKADGKS